MQRPLSNLVLSGFILFENYRYITGQLINFLNKLVGL